MFRNLSPGAIGIQAPLDDCLDLAKGTGFQGLDVSLQDVQTRSPDRVQAMFAEAGLRIGGTGLPVDYRKDDATFQADLAKLPEWAALAQAVGCTRMSTWVLPFSDELDFPTNYQLHLERFRAAASVLKDHSIRLGLEFIGPATMRRDHKYEFIHSMTGMLELCADVGTGNMGLLLDGWHWYTSHGTLDELNRLTRNDVVYVHINDAPDGIPIDEQIDNVRALPGETGVIDNVAFLRCLAQIGYDGPVTPEPFSQRVRDMAPEPAAHETSRHLTRVWEQAGLH